MATAFYMSSQNGELRYVDTTGVIHTLFTFSSNSFASTDAIFNHWNSLSNVQFVGMCFDAAGNLYICDLLGSAVYKLDRLFNLTTVLGSTTGAAFSGIPGPALGARMSARGIAIDSAGNLYVLDTGVRIYCINMQSTTQVICNVSIPAGAVQAIVGTGTSGFSGDGGQAIAAAINTGANAVGNSLVITPAGDLVFADTNNHRIRKVNHTTGVITTIVGTGTLGSTGDGGTALSANIDTNTDTGITCDANGNIVWDELNLIRAANFSGATATIFGVSIGNGNVGRISGQGTGTDGTEGYSGDGGAATAASIGQATALDIDRVTGALVIGFGNISLSNEARVRAITTAGIVSTVAGNGTAGFSGDGGSALIAEVDAYVKGVAYQPPSTGSPVASVVPASLAFSPQNIGTVSPAQTVVITNTGSTNLILAAVPLAFTGTDAANFGIGIGTTATPSLSIAPGGSAIVEVVFNPVALGLRNAQLVITDNSGGTAGAMQAVPLSGTGNPVVGGLSERNFACNGCFESSSAYGDVLKSLALSMAGFVVPPGDCWRIYAGSYVPPEITLADGDCRAAIKGEFRLSARDTCNGVKGQYIPAFLPINPLGPLASSPASPAWKKTDFPPVQRSAYLAEDGGVILWKDIQLDFTISLWMAQRIARIVLERLRRQVTISLPAKLTGLAALAADTINFLHARWSTVTPPVPTVFQISHTSLRMEAQADGVPAFGVDLILRQTDAIVYEFAPPTSPTNFGDYSAYGQTGIGAGNVV